MLKPPTFMCYVMIGIGVGMLMAAQTFSLHDINPTENNLFRYHMHEDEAKPVMRGLLHSITSVVCCLTLSANTIFKWSEGRHPSDFVMCYFLFQYFASAIYHRQRENVMLTAIFVNVDIGWIAATIIGSSAMIRFRKKRHVVYLFLSVVFLAGCYEILCRGYLSDYNVKEIWENYQQRLRKLPIGKMLNKNRFTEGNNVVWAGILQYLDLARKRGGVYLYSLPFEESIWAGLKVRARTTRARMKSFRREMSKQLLSSKYLSVSI